MNPAITYCLILSVPALRCKDVKHAVSSSAVCHTQQVQQRLLYLLVLKHSDASFILSA